MKNALLLNGTPKKNKILDDFYNKIIDLLEKRDWNVNSFLLRNEKVAPCQGCFDCWLKNPGECRIHDSARNITKKMAQSDLVIHFTPITFGGYSSELKKVIDRFIPNLLPFFKKLEGEVHHKQRYEDCPSIIAIGILPEFDIKKENTFRELVSRNSLNMGAPLHESLIYISKNLNEESINIFSNLLNKVKVNA